MSHILSTHKHHDHSGGNQAMKERYPDAMIIGGLDDQVLACTNPVTDGDKLNIHGINIECMHTPCHTRGHILYYC